MNKEDKKQGKYCSFCDYTGIIRNPKAYVMGEEPLFPCEKCVLSNCKCGGVEPYFYSEDGEIKECPCHSVRMRIVKINSIYHESGIDKKYKWQFINEFNCINKHAEVAKNSAWHIISNFPNVERGLFLWGNPGTGKTMLSAIILTELITRYGINGKFLKISRNFFGRLKSTFNQNSSTYGTGAQIEQELAEVDVLVVDDFGVQRDSEWEQETLYNLVDARYDAEKFTIFTSNLDPRKTMQELSQGRILSRIKEMCKILELSGPDYRERVKK